MLISIKTLTFQSGDRESRQVTVSFSWQYIDITFIFIIIYGKLLCSFMFLIYIDFACLRDSGTFP